MPQLISKLNYLHYIKSILSFLFVAFYLIGSISIFLINILSIDFLPATIISYIVLFLPVPIYFIGFPLIGRQIAKTEHKMAYYIMKHDQEKNQE